MFKRTENVFSQQTICFKQLSGKIYIWNIFVKQRKLHWDCNIQIQANISFAYTNSGIQIFSYYFITIQPTYIFIQNIQYARRDILLLHIQLQYVTKSNKQRPVLLLLYCFALFAFNICVTTFYKGFSKNIVWTKKHVTMYFGIQKKQGGKIRG